MEFNTGLEIGQVINNDNIRGIFKCGNMGGMRKSNTTKTLVIVSDHTKGLYEDHWQGDILHYTGMGKNGDQDINFLQNRTLNESNKNGIDVFLFEVVKPKEYIYMGQVMLCNSPYQEDQPDENGIMRKVWIFPVKLKNEVSIESISEKISEKNYIEKQKKAQRLSNLQLENRAKQTGNKKVGYRYIHTKVYERNSYVSEFAKRRSGGMCELCGYPSPFNNLKGEPYLETHHIDWLSKGGEDTIENTVALCPNCHKKMHIVKLQQDVEKLKQISKNFCNVK